MMKTKIITDCPEMAFRKNWLFTDSRPLITDMDSGRELFTRACFLIGQSRNQGD
jgi:hypothetical protein